jgi:phosphatidylserine/phosphatidylglycerophosphate/cardiolipin synthase-like enzyme
MVALPRPLQKWRDLFNPLPNYYGNEVVTLVDGDETYEAMYRALITARSKGHYIYLLGWSCDERVGLQGKGGNRVASTSLKSVLTRTPSAVQIRVMLWSQSKIMGGTYLEDTERVIKMINGLPNAAAISDGRLPLRRVSHHQKVMIVNGTDGVIGFCGGLDIYPDRVAVVKLGSPQHDIHCQVQGPSCWALIEVFDQRWRSHPEAIAIDNDKSRGPLIWRNGRRIYSKGSAYVRVTRTFNCVPLKQGETNAAADDNQDQAPDGDPSDPQVLERVSKRACKKERTVAEALFAAIEKTEKFIYVEEQYMIDLKVADALNKALNRGIDIMFLIPHREISAADMARRRKKFVKVVRAKPAKPDKNSKQGSLRVFYLVDPKTGKIGEHCYVHAKTWIFDDEMAIIGSANCNRRGLSSDTEANVCILDAPYKDDCLAKALRKRLWAEHLGIDAQDLDDPISSAKKWLDTKNKKSRVREYYPADAKDVDDAEAAIIGFYDPDLDGLPACSSNCC